MPKSKLAGREVPSPDQGVLFVLNGMPPVARRTGSPRPGWGTGHVARRPGNPGVPRPPRTRPGLVLQIGPWLPCESAA